MELFTIFQQVVWSRTTLAQKAIKKITPYIKKEYLEEAKKAFYENDFQRCAAILLEKYYDKVYKKRDNYVLSIKFDNIEKVLKEIKEFILTRTSLWD